MPQQDRNNLLLLAGIAANTVGTPQGKLNFAQILANVLAGRRDTERDALLGERQRQSDVRQFAQRDREAAALAKLEEIKAGATARAARTGRIRDFTGDIAAGIDAPFDSDEFKAKDAVTRLGAADPEAAFAARLFPAARTDPTATETVGGDPRFPGADEPARRVPVENALEKRSPQSRLPSPFVSEAEQARVNAEARVTGEATAQKREGIGPFLQDTSATAGLPGGDAFTTTIRAVQDDVLKSDAYAEFQNTMSSAIESRILAGRADELIAAGETRGIGQLDKQLATLLARSLETGRLTNDDIERALGVVDRAVQDALIGAFNSALLGQALLPEERDNIVFITRSRALERGLPLLEQEISLRLSPFQGIPPALMERLQGSLDINGFLDLIGVGDELPAGDQSGTAADFARQAQRR